MPIDKTFELNQRASGQPLWDAHFMMQKQETMQGNRRPPGKDVTSRRFPEA